LTFGQEPEAVTLQVAVEDAREVIDGALAIAPKAVPDFQRDVRPILTQNCFGCHGPDDRTRESDLRFDIATDLTEDLGGYSIVVPGNAAESELIFRIMDTDEPMPPLDALEQLTEEEKQILTDWIDAGAIWTDHWAFLAPERPELPAVNDQAWILNELDTFILAKLEAESLTPEPATSRAAWLRRASFDLIGLPPTVEELDAFEADTKPGAFDRQVDRLFASPRYGERQAQDWLDLARYADSNGNQFDQDRSNWKWREWVIEAYNANMPYDKFTVDQLAGDLLENPTLDQLVATGFNRNHQTDMDTPSEADEYRTEYVIDRVHTTATAFMGMTMACAQCHSHKFDPISHEDYYSFFGFFSNVAERDIDYGNPRPNMRVPNPDQAPMLADFDQRIAELEARLDGPDILFDRGQTDWESRMQATLGDPVAWDTLEASGMLSHNGARLRPQDDGSIKAVGPSPARDTYDLVFQPGKRLVQAIRLEVLPDPSFPGGASGRAADGTFRLSKLVLRDASLSDGTDPPQVYMAFAGADITQDSEDKTKEYTEAVSPGNFEGTIVYEKEDDDEDEGGFGRGGGWTLVGRAIGERHEALLIPMEPITMNAASLLKITMEQNSRGTSKNQIGRFRWSVTSDVSVRELMLPMAPKHWSALGPFPAESAELAYAEKFEPESKLDDGIDRKAKFIQPVLEKKEDKTEGGKKSDAKGQKTPKPAGLEQAVAFAAAAELGVPGAPAGAVALVAVDVAATPLPTPQAKLAAADAKPEQAPAAAQQGKAGGEAAAKPEGQPGAKAQAKPGADKKAEPKQDGEKKAEAAKPAPAPKAKSKPRPVELTWNEKKTWKSGESNQVKVGIGAYYFTREVHALRPGIAKLRLDGPVGVKVWLNGEVVFQEEPEPVVEKKQTQQMQGGFGGFFSRGGGSSAAKREVRLGFRKGVNELLVKAIYRSTPTPSRRGGEPSEPTGSITFDFTSEGEDVMTFEVLSALRSGPAVPVQDSLATKPAASPSTGLATTLKVAAKQSAGPSPKAPVGVEGKDSLASEDKDDVQKNSANGAGAKLLAPPSLPGVNRTDLMGIHSIQPAPQTYELPTDDRIQHVLRDHYRRNVSTIGRALGRELERLQKERGTYIRDIPETLVMAERETPRDNYLFLSGDFRQRGQDVEIDTPSALPPMDASLPKNRLGLARWLTSGDHPLTARVAVNRMWQTYFGTGINKTPGDFGIRAELPSHPELLDWMAVEFVESGWDVQAMQRRIILSQTYRQAAESSPEKFAADPANRMLARGPRTRLSAEMVRDNALSLSGLLVQELGGKSVKPYQSKGIWTEIFGGRDWSKDKGEAQYRRGLYTYWRRRAPNPSMTTFDAQKGEVCTVTRPKTNTPLQALVLLNNPVYVEASRVFAQRMLDEDLGLGSKPAAPASKKKGEPKGMGKAKQAEPVQAEAAAEAIATVPAPTASAEDHARIAMAFRMATSRKATEAELEILADLLMFQRAAYATNEEGAAKLIKIGDAPGLDKESEVTASELAAWTALMSALLNLDATIHKG
jgi:hypothetical protein